MPPALRHKNTIHTPAGTTSAFATRNGETLLIGTADGVVRMYNLTAPDPTRVVKAIRGLRSEVSSIALPEIGGSISAEPALRAVWIAAGKNAYKFDLTTGGMIVSSTAAKQTIAFGDDDEDAVNELSFNHAGSMLAFSTDNGTAGVLDTTTLEVVQMKVQHKNICGSIKFVPHRPNELVSGGYDSALLHFDHAQRSLLSRHTFGAPPPSEGLATGLSFSPPFVLCTSMSPSGLLAVGTADGRLWIGTGGEKTANRGTKKKRSRKWEGLRPEGAIEERIAEGPVVGVAFVGDDDLCTCTLLGTLAHFKLVRSPDSSENGTMSISKTSTMETSGIAKINFLVATVAQVVVGGISEDGKGVTELWELAASSEPTQSKNESSTL